MGDAVLANITPNKPKEKKAAAPPKTTEKQVATAKGVGAKTTEALSLIKSLRDRREESLDINARTRTIKMRLEEIVREVGPIAAPGLLDTPAEIGRGKRRVTNPDALGQLALDFGEAVEQLGSVTLSKRKVRAAVKGGIVTSEWAEIAFSEVPGREKLVLNWTKTKED